MKPDTFVFNDAEPPQPPYSPEPSGHLARNMAYEIAVTLVTGGVTLLMVCVVFGGQLQDLYLRLRGPAPLSEQVSVVTIGPEALYLWRPDQPQPEITPRPLLSAIVQFLTAAEADVIVLDYLLDRPQASDNTLLFAAEAHGRVLSAESFSVTPSSGRRFMPGTARSLREHVQGAFANLIEEHPSPLGGRPLVRRAHLVQRVSRTQTTGPWPQNLVGAFDQEDAVVPSLALAAAWLHTHPGATVATLEDTLHRHCPDAPTSCVNADKIGLKATPHDLSRPLEINYRGPEHADRFSRISAARILRAMGQSVLMDALGVPTPLHVPSDLKAALKGRVVVVMSTQSDDRFVTPYAFPTYAQDNMAGGLIQAHLIDTLLSGAHLRRTPSAIGALLGLGLSLAAIRTRGRVGDGTHALLFALIAPLLMMAAAALFVLSDGLLVGVELPIALSLCTVFLLHLRGWALEDALDATELNHPRPPS